MEGISSSPVSHPLPSYSLDDQEHTQNYISEAINAEKQLWRLVHLEGLLCTNVQKLYRKVRSSYEKIILDDHELAQLQDIEYSLWKLHYKHIDEFRNRIRESLSNKECKNVETMQNNTTEKQNCNKLREGFESFLSEATQFYQDLIVKIRRSYGLAEEVTCFNDSLSNSRDLMRIQRCQFSCHRYLVSLGDLARYRELYGNPNTENRTWSVAATHYIHASMIQPHSGNPQNQLALLAIYIGDEFLALYHCIRSLAVKEPFPDAWNNLTLLFEKNKSSHLHSLSDEATFNFLKPSDKSTVKTKEQSSNNPPHYHSRKASGDIFPEGSCFWPLIVRMISFFYVKSSLKDFTCIFSSTIRELESLLSLDDARLKASLESYHHMGVIRRGPFRGLQLVSILIFTIHMLTESPKPENSTQIRDNQQPSLTLQALASTFIIMGRLINRCVMSKPLGSSPLLPAILVFVEWLVDMLGTAEAHSSDKETAAALTYFFNAFVDLLNQFETKGFEIKSSESLWEDTELIGFSPISKVQEQLDFHRGTKTNIGSDGGNECEVRMRRILVAAMKITNRSNGSQKWIFYEKTKRSFSTAEPDTLMGDKESKGAGDNHNKSDLHCTSSPIEEEEVILFKPIIRYNSAPLYVPETSSQITTERIGDLGAPSGECFRRVSSLKLLKLSRSATSIDPSTLCPDVNDSSYSSTFWQDPIPEDSEVNSFTEYPTDSQNFGTGDKMDNGLSYRAGPPSLNAWVLNRENSGNIGAKGSTDATKYGSRAPADIVPGYITNLAISETAVTVQDANVKSSAPSSSFMYGFSSHGDSDIAHPYSSTSSHNMASHWPPLPSAPLLPDDATWFTGDSFSATEQVGLEAMKERSFGGAQGSPHLNSTGTKGALKFESNTPKLSNGYRPFSDRLRSSHWSPQFQENSSLERVHERVSPLQFYSPTSAGISHDQNMSRFLPSAQMTNPLTSLHMKHLEDMTSHTGFRDANARDGPTREWLFNGCSKPSPHVYGVATELRSEQLLLLQYLKEKEWHLQREARVRGST